MSNSRKAVVSATNATLVNEDQSSHIDLFAANGTLLLGHSNPTAVEALVAQARKVWITGRLDTDTRLLAYASVEDMLPDPLKVAGFYSTGMEAAEFALRASRVLTGRKDVVGFDRCMHGKSSATAFLAWPNPFGHDLPGFHRVPFPTPETADDALARLEQVLGRRQTAAVFLEAIQGSGGGASVSSEFCESLRKLCSDTGTLLVADEILTGFHRTGPLFFYQRFPLEPDIVLAGKCMGNGFPVSAVLMGRDHELSARMLPYSTYSENALAMAAIVGTLQEIKRLPVERLAMDIQQAIRTSLDTFHPESIRLTVYGAMCIIDLGDSQIAAAIANQCYDGGVLVSQAGPILRLLPPLTIPTAELEQGLATLAAALDDNLPPTVFAPNALGRTQRGADERA
mgnify:CR=1 FL=1